MGYINLPRGIPGFNKAIISFWFRAPKESLEDMKKAAQAEQAKAGNNQFYTYPRLNGVLPLLTFGRLFEGYHLDGEPAPDELSYTVNDWFTPGGAWTIFKSEAFSYSKGSVLVKKSLQPINPSVIGVSYGGEKDEEEGGGSIYRLYVNLQTEDRGGTKLFNLSRNFIGDYNTGSPSGTADVEYEEHWDDFIGECVSHAPPPGNPHIERVTMEDVTELWMGQQGPDSFTSPFTIEVKPDTWHHVLISFDLSKSTRTQGPEAFSDNGDCGPETFEHVDNVVRDPCQLWIAFDDKNYTNYTDTDPITAEERGLFGPNDWLSRHSSQGYFAPGGTNHSVQWSITGVVSDGLIDAGSPGNYTFKASPLPSKDVDFGIPAGANCLDYIRDVDMAEFQLFTGYVLDTSEESKRRAFIDFKRDSEGRKIVDRDGKGTLKPVPPRKAEEILNIRPDILFHGVSHWKKGKNTGSLGLRRKEEPEPDEVIPEGQFEPKGTILRYKPDPSVGEGASESASSVSATA